MADNAERLSGKIGLDTTDFKTGLAGMNRELRVIESGFRASAASLGDWSQNASGLEMRIKSLTDKIEIQKQKVAATREEYERIKTATGATSIATQEMEIKLNKETETLGKMGSELRKTEGALKGVKAPTEEAGKAAEQSAPKWDGLKNVLGGVGAAAKATVVMLLGLVAGVAAAAVAVGGLVFSSGNAASALMDMSEKTGISTTRLQELQYFGSQYKLTLDTIATSQARMTRSMATAAGGTGDAAEAWETLGVSVTNADGSLRDQEDVFGETIDALGKIENAAERDAMAMAIFGRGAQELNPLINAGSGELKKFSREAHLMGAVVSEDGIKALDNFRDQFDATILSLKGMGASIAVLIVPDFSQFLSGVQGLLMEVAYLLKGSGGDITKILNGYFEVTPDGRVLFHEGIIEMLLGIVDLIAANAPKLAEGGLQILNALLLGIIENLPRLLTAGSTMIAGIMQALVDNLPQIISSGTVILTALLDAITENLPILLPMAVEIITALVNGLAAAAPQMSEPIGLAIGLIIGAIIAAIIENFPVLVQAGADLIGGIAQGLANAVPQSAKDAIEAFLTELGLDIAIGAVVLQEKAAVLVQNLKDGFIANLSIMVGLSTPVGTAVVSAVTGAIAAVKKAGASIVQGLWDGILGQKGWLQKKVEEFVNGVIDAILEALGNPKSPAPATIPAGKYTVMGFEKGMTDEFQEMNKRMAVQFGNLAFSPAFASAGSLAGVVNNNNDNSIANPVYINGLQIPGAGPGTTIADIMDFLNKRG